MIVFLFAILSAIYDKGKRFTNHLPRFIFRAIVVLVISYFSEGNFFINFAQNTAIFYLLFDYALNILEGRKWYYIGNTAKIDLLWHKLGGWVAQLIFKILLLVVSINLLLILNYLKQC